MKESTEHILENTNDRQVDPDGMHVVIDAERWYFLGVSHRFSGCEWGGIEICARTFEETQARLDAAASTGKITQTVAVFRDSFFGEYRARFTRFRWQ